MLGLDFIDSTFSDCHWAALPFLEYICDGVDGDVLIVFPLLQTQLPLTLLEANFTAIDFQ